MQKQEARFSTCGAILVHHSSVSRWSWLEKATEIVKHLKQTGEDVLTFGWEQMKEMVC